MKDIVRRDIFDFCGNQMIAQSVRNDPDDPLKRIISCSIQFYGRKIVVEPTWHPWFGPVFVSADEYAPAGISPLIIPTPIALEHRNRADMLCMEEGLERIMTETKIRMIEQLPDTIKEYRIDPPMIDNSKHNLQNTVKINLRDYVAFEVIKEPFVKGIFIDRYIPVNEIFFEYSNDRSWSEKTIYIPKNIIPSNMEVNARSMYSIIAQQHRENYEKYVVSTFREIAQSNTTKLLWINVRYWSRLEEHVEENPVSAMKVQTIQKTKYGLTVGRER